MKDLEKAIQDYNKAKQHLVEMIMVAKTEMQEDEISVSSTFNAQLSPKVIRFHDIEMNLTTRQVYKRSTLIKLSNILFKILHHFVANPFIAHSRETLLQYTLKKTPKGVRVVDVYIARLREAFDKVRCFGSPERHAVIRTVDNVGYKLDIA